MIHFFAIALVGFVYALVLHLFEYFYKQDVGIIAWGIVIALVLPMIIIYPFDLKDKE